MQPLYLQFLYLALLAEGFFQGVSNRARLGRLSSTFSCCPIADELNGWNTDAGSDFLEKYWQKKPVLIRNAFPHISYDVEFLSRADMFSMSYNEDVESRILVKDEDGVWNKEYGPFDSKYTRKLPKKDWTILVQEVDRHIPRMADMWGKYFDFIPSWRRDDIMVSYAAEGGGIGAHVDSYDVFLVQGRGRRVWSIENSFVSAAEELRREVPNCDTRLISDFRADQTWELNQGDVLYLPPRVPHQGVSLTDECTTVSMGFRSPTHRSMVTALCDFICQNTVPERLMYTDPTLKLQQSSGFIGSDARETIKNDIEAHILRSLDDQKVFDYWLGRYLTIPLRMQLMKPKPFYLQSNARRSLRSLFAEKGLSRLDSPERKEGAVNSGIGSEIGSGPGSETVSSILSGQSYEDEDDYDDDDEDEPFFLRGQYRVASTRIFTDVIELLLAVQSEEVTLRRTEGTKLAFIETALFVDGEAYEFPVGGGALGSLLCDRRVLTKSAIESCNIDLSSGGCGGSPCRMFLEALIEGGYFYPCDI